MAVTIAERIHLFPYRTQKLSSLAPKVLGLTAREDRLLPPSIHGNGLHFEVRFFFYTKQDHRFHRIIGFMGGSISSFIIPISRSI